MSRGGQPTGQKKGRCVCSGFRSGSDGTRTRDLRVVERERGPAFYGKWRDSTGRQIKRKLGPAWTGNRCRAPEGSLDERGAIVALAAAIEAHEAALLKPRVDRTVTFTDAAAAWLHHLESEKAALDKAQVEIDGIADPAKKVEPQAALTDARAALGAASSPADAEGVSEARKKVEIAIQKAKQATPQVDFLVAGPGRGSRAAAARAADEIAGLGRRLFSSGSLGGLKVITYALAGLIAAWAILALHQTIYASNPAFGTDADYLALITAAIGSGAVGSILGLMAIWDPSSPAED